MMRTTLYYMMIVGGIMSTMYLALSSAESKFRQYDIVNQESQHVQ